ncbi:unnamed protein product [Ambrosiozyma monospora]|uniref:Unnamed protein product n=1 Tax=Ambrosiozyma monospora TaxID=43982 RepID=A0ACB5T732_AMBMO|nr:unnamed protein product [Ambrosiozyma monospora]
MSEEKFKVKYGKNLEDIKAKTPTVLLPVSLGESSLVLLDIVVSQLEEQSAMNRAHIGYKLVVVIIDESDFDNTGIDIKENVQKLKEVLGTELLDKLDIKFKIVKSESYVTSNRLQKIFLTHDFKSFSVKSENDLDIDLKTILLQTLDKSTREDLLNIVRKETILRTAIAENCSVVLFGHSMSKLADDILSLAVKGRGSEISDNLTDGIIEYEQTDLHILHPLRDILFSEIKEYSKLSGLSELALNVFEGATVKKSIKNKTINELIKDYFRSVEVEYPEVISTVVKIGSKMAHPPTQDDFQIKNCILCNNAIYNDPKHWLEQITVHGGAPLESEEERANLEAYLASVKDKKSDSLLHESDKVVPLCYGCIVNLGTTGQSGFIWPTKRPSKQEILDEYVLTDDEEED